MARSSWGEERPNAEEPRWDLVVHEHEPYFQKVALGNGTAFRILAVWCTEFPGRGPVLAVGVEERSFFAFQHFVHWSYLQEKMKLLNGDARNLADWVNTQLGLYKPTMAQGVYSPPYVVSRVVPIDLQAHFAEAHPETPTPGETI